MAEKQVKSRQRVADHGEVFTAEREVRAMCDLVKSETERIESRFLEPACGNGNFLAEVLRRKLAVVKSRYGKNPSDYERYSVLAVTSIYGVDILAEQGVPVRAMDNGTVVEVVNDPLWGICVSVDHENGIVSRYCNLSPNVGVQEGDTVESGQTLGTVGDSADIESKMESHLHFEVTKGGDYIDPYAYVQHG